MKRNCRLKWLLPLSLIWVLVHACENQGLAILPTPAALAGFWEGQGLSAETADAVDLSLVPTGTHAYAFVHTGEVCTVSSDLELEVHAKPELAVVSENEVCPDSVLVLEVDVQAAAFPVAVEWAIDETTVPGDTTVLSVLWPTDGTHAVAVSATDDWGCSNSMDWDVVVLEVSSVDAVESLAVCNQAIPVDLSDYAVASEGERQCLPGWAPLCWRLTHWTSFTQKRSNPGTMVCSTRLFRRPDVLPVIPST